MEWNTVVTNGKLKDGKNAEIGMMYHGGLKNIRMLDLTENIAGKYNKCRNSKNLIKSLEIRMATARDHGVLRLEEVGTIVELRNVLVPENKISNFLLSNRCHFLPFTYLRYS